MARAAYNGRFLGSLAAAMVAAAGTTASAQTVVRWTGAGGNTDFMNPANWDPQVVPINGMPNPGDTYSVVVPANVGITFGLTTPANVTFQTLSLAAGATITTRPGRVVSVLGDADILGNIDATQGGSFLAPNAVGPILNGSWFRVAAGGTVRVGAASYAMNGVRYGNYTIFSAAGAGSLFDGSSLTSLNAGWNDQDGNTYATTVSASDGGVVDLSGVQSLVTPARGEDRIDFVMSTGGNINLDSLEHISGGGRARFVLGVGQTYSLPSLTTASQLMLELPVGATLSLPSTTALSSSSFSLADGATLDAPSLVNLFYSTWNISPTRTFVTGPMTNIDASSFNVRDGATWGRSTGNLAESLTYSMTNIRYGNYTIFSADGTGSVFDGSSINTLNAGWNDQDGNTYVTYVAAANNGVVDLSGVQTLVTPARSEDRIDFLMSTGGNINLDALEQITGGGRARFVLGAGQSYELPSLTTASRLALELPADAAMNMPSLIAVSSDGAFNLDEGARVDAVSLTSMNGVGLSMGVDAVFNAPSLVTATASAFNIAPGRTITTGPMTNIDASSFNVRDGATWGRSTGNLAESLTYSMTNIRYGGYTIFSADGTGSVFDGSSINTLNAGWNDQDGNTYVTYVAAANNGVVDLSGVQTLVTPARGEDRIDFLMSTGGNINLDALEQITGGGRARFVLGAGQSYELPSLRTADRLLFELPLNSTLSMPSLTSLSSSSLTMADGATFDAPLMLTLFNSTLNISSGRTIATGPLSSIDASSINVRDGSTWGRSTGDLAATLSYSMTGIRYGNYTVFSADGTGSVFDGSSINTLNAGWNDQDGNTYATTVSATNAGTVDLSGVQSLVTPARGEDRIDFVASSSGLIDLSGLRSVTGGGQARFLLSGGGQMRLGDITVGNNVQIAVQDIDSRLSVERSLTINSGSFSVAAGAEVAIGKHFAHRLTNEASFQASTSIIRMTGSGIHFLEIAGLDLGPINPGNNGNFGLGHLIIGAEDAPLTVQLLDVLDNGNRGQNQPEALYLFGVGQGMDSDALTLLGGSTLYIDHLNVYVRENGSWLWLNSLFGPGQSVISYGGGFVHLPAPGAASLLLAGLLAAARRRRPSLLV